MGGNRMVVLFDKGLEGQKEDDKVSDPNMLTNTVE